MISVTDDRLLPRWLHWQQSSIQDIRGHRSHVHALAWNCSGNALATGSTDHSVRLFQANNSTHLSSSEEMQGGHRDAVEQLAFHPSQETTLASASTDKTVRLWDTRAANSTTTIVLPGENINVCWYDEWMLLVGDKNDCVSVVDIRHPTVVKAFRRFSTEINEMAVSPDGFIQLTNGTGRISRHGIDLANVDGVQGHTSNCYSIDICGKRMVVGGADALVSVWSLSTDDNQWYCVRTLGDLEWPVRSVSLSRDDALIAAGSEDTQLVVWDAHCGAVLHRIPTAGALNCLSFSPQCGQSRYILAWAADEVDPRSGRPCGSIRLATICPSLE